MTRALVNDARLMSVHDAIAILDATDLSARVERKSLLDASGLRLAEAIVNDRDAPAFDKALMDGFAVRASDIATAPADLAVIGEIAAGKSFDKSIANGECVAIMTGAPLPGGADAVVPVEWTESSEQRVVINRLVKRGYAVAPAGSDLACGAVALNQGVLLGAAQLAVAASVGASWVQAFAKPRVAVLSTGDELVPVEVTPKPAQIRDSNGPMIAALLRKLGCEVTLLPVARDEHNAVRAAVYRGLSFDALFVCGGMSMGRHDHVPRVLQELNVNVLISKLRIKPGKPFVFGTHEGVNGSPSGFVFGLPGNPVSAFICTLRLASRVLTRLGGGVVHDKWLMGKLDAGLPLNGDREFYQPAIWTPKAGSKSAANEFASVTPLTWKGSADVYTLARANVLLVRPENEPPLPKGTLVRVLEIP